MVWQGLLIRCTIPKVPNAPKRVCTTVKHDIEGTDAEESTAPNNNPTNYMSDVDNEKDDNLIAKYEKMKETFQKVYKVCSHFLVQDLTIQLFIQFRPLKSTDIEEMTHALKIYMSCIQKALKILMERPLMAIHVMFACKWYISVLVFNFNGWFLQGK